MSQLTQAVRNPLAYLAERWTPTSKTVQRAALSSVVMIVVIVVTGGAVRLTSSGLGCPTWPSCTEESLTTTREMGLHGVIEFGNRLLTYAVSAAVGWTILAARSAKPWRRSLTRLGWWQFWLVMGNAVLGGITVLTDLNPYTVASHFLLTTALLTVALVTWQRTREGDAAPRPLVGLRIRRLVQAMVGVSAVLIAVGTVVTGAGPHPGDSSEVPRIPVDWEGISKFHAAFAWLLVLLALALWAVMRAVDAPAGPRARTRELLAILVAQGAIGYVQYFTGMPEVLVAAHMLGSCLLWIAVLRLLLSLRERPLPPASPTSTPTPGEASAPLPTPSA